MVGLLLVLPLYNPEKDVGVWVTPLLPFDADEVVHDSERRVFLANPAMLACRIGSWHLDEVLLERVFWLILSVSLILHAAGCALPARKPMHQLGQLVHELSRHDGGVLIAEPVWRQAVPSKLFVGLIALQDLRGFALELLRRIRGAQPQQLSHDDCDQDVRLSGVGGKRHEELGRAQLLVHVQRYALLRKYVGARARDVPQGCEHLTSALLIFALPTWRLAADPHVDVAREALLNVHLQEPHDVGRRCLEARVQTQEAFAGVLRHAPIAILPAARAGRK